MSVSLEGGVVGGGRGEGGDVVSVGGVGVWGVVSV